jgi:hypothetical protein
MIPDHRGSGQKFRRDPHLQRPEPAASHAHTPMVWPSLPTQGSGGPVVHTPMRPPREFAHQHSSQPLLPLAHGGAPGSKLHSCPVLTTHVPEHVSLARQGLGQPPPTQCRPQPPPPHDFVSGWSSLATQAPWQLRTPFLHSLLGVHCAPSSGLHGRHMSPWHPNGQEVVRSGHVPRPSQLAAAVKAPAEHPPCRQGVPAANTWQAPLPSHDPMLPQVSGRSGAQSSVTAPTLVGAQTPFVPPVSIAEQEKHLSVHGLSQQTPSTQSPDAH